MKILLIKLSSIGDIVHAMPAFNLLSRFYPDAQIDWLIYEKFQKLITGHPRIRQIKVLKDKKPKTLWATGSALKKERYDLVIDMQGLIKTAFLSFLIGGKNLGFSQPREKIATIFYDRQASCQPILANDKHIIEKNIDLIQSLSKFDSTVKSENNYQIDFAGFFEKQNPALNSRLKICIIPGTTWPSKLWAKENWLALINYFRNKYNGQIFITGSSKDLMIIEDIIINFKKPIALMIDKSFMELKNFYQEMDIIVGVDTGPLHIAAAVNFVNTYQKKIVGIYGPTSGKRTGPYGFSYVSADELTNTPASHKKSLEEDNYSIMRVEVNHVLKQLGLPEHTHL